ncbi:MAG: hypothetical protein LBL13_05635 [Bacteroidales bacterium]|nr:hypothetical protein [Bacteroidales bacterium]
MKKLKNTLFVSLFLLAGMLLYSCEKKPARKQIFLSLNFDHRINNTKVVLDMQYYTNAANNKYRLNEIKYFISSFRLYRNGAQINIEQDNGIHYVDLSYKNTLVWDISQNIPEGLYDSVGFIFGLNEKDNQSYRFNNPPESNMGWTQMLGGGYHYMMLNGWFYQADTMPLNIHLGRGQIYRGNTRDIDSLIGFVDNYFYVSLPKSFLVKRDRTATATIVMNIDKWFQEPFVYDFNYWGSHIMQNQPAMQMLKENGHNVFTIE